MVSRIGSGPAGAQLRRVNEDDVADEMAERDRQQLAVARRLVARPELGISRITVCGLLDTYVVEAPALPAASAAGTSHGAWHGIATLRRRIENRSAATR